jgi:broad specificity phosphatase PhoE
MVPCTADSQKERFYEFMLMEIYLVRHAAPNRALNIPYHLPPGPPLTDQGHVEAQQAADWLVGRGIEHCYSSPFARTTATVEPIVERLGCDVTFSDVLREAVPGETMDTMRQRIAGLLSELDTRHRCVGLVSHGACIRALLLETTNGQIDLARHVYDYGNPAPTAGIWHGVRTEAGWRWELAFRPSQNPVARPTPQPDQTTAEPVVWV